MVIANLLYFSRFNLIIQSILGLLLLLSIGGCRSYSDKTRKIKLAYSYSNYDEALKSLEESNLSGDEPLLYLLEKAMILDRSEKLEDSRKSLFKADRLIDKLYTKSISKEAVSFIYNDTAQDYSGEDYEKVAVHIMLALSFLEEGKLNSALVEARKINSRLHEINSRYGDDKNRYSQDAFARYLSAMIYQSQGEWDSAIIDYKKALELYSENYRKNFSIRKPPKHLVDSLHSLLLKRDRRGEARRLKTEYKQMITDESMGSSASHGELVVIHELGLVAAKQAHDFVVGLGREIHRLSFPIIYPKSPYRFGRTGVSIDKSGFSTAYLVQNMDQIAAKTLEDRRLRLIAKQAARLILKSQINQRAQKEFGPLGGLAVNIFNVVTETADTRSWNLLPSAFYVTRVSLRPGTYKVKVFTDGRLSELKKVSISAGRMNFIRSSSFANRSN